MKARQPLGSRGSVVVARQAGNSVAAGTRPMRSRTIDALLITDRGRPVVFTERDVIQSQALRFTRETHNLMDSIASA